MTIIRTRKPSPYVQALIDLAFAVDHCRAIMEAVGAKLPPNRVVLWDDRPCDSEPDGAA